MEREQTKKATKNDIGGRAVKKEPISVSEITI